MGILRCICFLSHLLSCSGRRRTFKIPEKFVYDLTWTGIKAGTASLEFVNDGDKMKIISTAQIGTMGICFLYRRGQSRKYPLKKCFSLRARHNLSITE